MRGYSPLAHKMKKPTKPKEDLLTRSPARQQVKSIYQSRMVGTSAPPKPVYMTPVLGLTGESPMKNFLGNKKPNSDKKPSLEKKNPATLNKCVKHTNTHPNGFVQVTECEFLESIGFFSQAGRSDGRAKTNQDSFFIDTEIGGLKNFALFGVFDGHGFHGHKVSNYLVSNIRDIFELKEMEDGNFNFEATFIDLCHNLNKMLKKAAHIDSKLSGSTGIKVLATKNKLVCSNVGDSRAMMIRKTHNGHLETVPMSIDQKPSDPQEKQRILSHGGRVYPCRSMIQIISAFRWTSWAAQSVDQRR